MASDTPTMYTSALLTSQTAATAGLPTSNPQPTTTANAIALPVSTAGITPAQVVPGAHALPQTNVAVAAAAAATAAAAAAAAQVQASVNVDNKSTIAAAAQQTTAAAQGATAQIPQMAFQQYPAGMVFAAPDPSVIEDQPTYVNPKQYARILKRRESRKKQTGTDVTSYTPRKRSYMHESRHKHAMQRRRGPGGRFLSKEERDNEINRKETTAVGQ